MLEAHLLLRNQVGERRAKNVRLLLCLLGCAKVFRGDARGPRGLHRLRLPGRNEAGPAPARMFPAGPASFLPGYRFARCQACFDCQTVERTTGGGLRDWPSLVTICPPLGVTPKYTLTLQRFRDMIAKKGGELMPTTKKRINLTVSEHVYQQLQSYKEDNGFSSDAAACMQLIVQQLKSQETTKAMLNALRQITPEQLRLLSNEGLMEIKAVADNTADDA